MINNKTILKLQLSFRKEKHDVFTEEIDKITLSSNDDKRMQSTDSIETYENETSNNLVSRKERLNVGR